MRGTTKNEQSLDESNGNSTFSGVADAIKLLGKRNGAEVTTLAQLKAET